MPLRRVPSVCGHPSLVLRHVPRRPRRHLSVALATSSPLEWKPLMNTTLTAPQRVLDESTSQDALTTTLQLNAPRTALLDRIALRIALTLLLWSTRPPDHAHAVDRALRNRELRRQREQRELRWELQRHFTGI